MSLVRSRVSIASSPSDVWDHLVDWERMNCWFVGVRRVRLLAAEPSVGAVRLLQLAWGPTHRERITRWEPPAGFSIEVLDPPFIGRDWTADIDLHERPGGVDVAWDLRFEPRFGPAGRIVDRLLIRPALRIAFRWSLRNLRAAIEVRRPPGTASWARRTGRSRRHRTRTR